MVGNATTIDGRTLVVRTTPAGVVLIDDRAGNTMVVSNVSELREKLAAAVAAVPAPAGTAGPVLQATVGEVRVWRWPYDTGLTKGADPQNGWVLHGDQALLLEGRLATPQ